MISLLSLFNGLIHVHSILKFNDIYCDSERNISEFTALILGTLCCTKFYLSWARIHELLFAKLLHFTTKQQTQKHTQNITRQKNPPFDFFYLTITDTN